MGIYWNAQTYVKDTSYIVGEVRSRNIYEIDLKACSKYLVRRLDIKGGIEILNSLKSQKKYVVDIERTPMSNSCIFNLFYIDSNDLIGYENVRIDNEGNKFCIAWDPSTPFRYINELSNGDSEFKHIDDASERRGLEDLLLILKEAVEKDYIVLFYWE